MTAGGAPTAGGEGRNAAILVGTGSRLRLLSVSVPLPRRACGRSRVKKEKLPIEVWGLVSRDTVGVVSVDRPTLRQDYSRGS